MSKQEGYWWPERLYNWTTNKPTRGNLALTACGIITPLLAKHTDIVLYKFSTSHSEAKLRDFYFDEKGTGLFTLVSNQFKKYCQEESLPAAWLILTDGEDTKSPKKFQEEYKDYFTKGRHNCSCFVLNTGGDKESLAELADYLGAYYVDISDTDPDELHQKLYHEVIHTIINKERTVAERQKLRQGTSHEKQKVMEKTSDKKESKTFEEKMSDLPKVPHNSSINSNPDDFDSGIKKRLKKSKVAEFG